MSASDLGHVRPWRMIERRKSRQIHVGPVPIGGDAPIAVQTMTNTLTSDAGATIDQIRGIEEAGADIVRVSCPDEESTAALGEIVTQLQSPRAPGLGGPRGLDRVHAGLDEHAQ